MLIYVLRFTFVVNLHKLRFVSYQHDLTQHELVADVVDPLDRHNWKAFWCINIRNQDMRWNHLLVSQTACDMILNGKTAIEGLAAGAGILYDATGENSKSVECFNIVKGYGECADPTGCGLGNAVAWNYQVRLLWQARNFVLYFSLGTTIWPGLSGHTILC